MSKINQIQNRIQELDGGAFQKLLDEYLARRGYSPIVSIGSVVGANKTTVGTPDTLFLRESGKYIFAEHTTQVGGVERKFADDLQKCFDETKTGISLSKIERVILCSTSNLGTSSIEHLRKIAQSRGVPLEIVGIHSLSYDLLVKFPGIAVDHLGVEVDTGQILDVEGFVAAYGRNRLATPLNTTFLFRNEEIDAALHHLEQSDLLIISGPPGVGKSRLALECSRYFVEKHPKYKANCIFNRGPDIFNDLTVYFAAPGRFLIFVDDANRLPGFDYVVQMLMDQRNDQRIKVVATVRDYALDKIRASVRKAGDTREISIDRFSDEEVREFIKSEFEIDNYHFVKPFVPQ